MHIIYTGVSIHERSSRHHRGVCRIIKPSKLVHVEAELLRTLHHIPSLTEWCNTLFLPLGVAVS